MDARIGNPNAFGIEAQGTDPARGEADPARGGRGWLPMLKPAVEVRDEGGLMVAEFWDCLRLDPAPVRELRDRFEAHLKRGGRPDLVVDLNGVGFAGSAALGGFLSIHKLSRHQSGRLVFCNVDPTVREVFRVSKLESLFAFADDKPAAVAFLDRSDPADGPPESPPTPPSSSGSGAPPLRGRRRPS